ncbi:hypothetical protein O0I10_000637 [Lichtheimia ornata]|uniref:Uncharacterized protein n=1 Tax=Lichtheimia ornata TaxID=688661 RepID=A0AAD7Y410_9FUNG|nr:uncharacterized protein O0I10_000637 [Lichtheimia ornata]KAJ8663398.1 hypothetical protein O0I10_000637 [Lichtheimia ornata]
MSIHVGNRIQVGAVYATVRFYGHVEGIKGEWLRFGKIEDGQRSLSNLKVVGLALLGILGSLLSGVFVKSTELVGYLVRTTEQLSELMILRLNHCCLEPPGASIDHAAFSSITTLDLQLGKNDIQHLTNPATDNQFPHHKCVNLEDNEISSWDEIAKLGCLPSLDILYLNGNKIPFIQPIEANTLPKLEFLRINPIVAPLSREEGMLKWRAGSKTLNHSGWRHS